MPGTRAFNLANSQGELLNSNIQLSSCLHVKLAIQTLVADQGIQERGKTLSHRDSSSSSGGRLFKQNFCKLLRRTRDQPKSRGFCNIG